jgi:hypothetical protein
MHPQIAIVNFLSKYSWIMSIDFHLQSDEHSYLKFLVLALLPMDSKNM